MDKRGIFLIVAAVILFISVPLCGVLFASAHHKQALQNPDFIQFQIGAETLRMPKNYFWSLPKVSRYLGADMHMHDAEDKDQKEFVIQVLYPGMTPRNAENETEFDRPGWHDQISIHVKSKSPLLHETARLQVNYRQKIGGVTDGPAGNKKFDMSGKREILFKGVPENPSSFYMCSQDKSVSSPFCERDVYIAPDISMNYAFSKKYFGDAAEMEQKIIAMFNEYLESGPHFQAMR